MYHSEMLSKHAGPQELPSTHGGGSLTEGSLSREGTCESSRELCQQVLSQGLGGSHSCVPAVLGNCPMTPWSSNQQVF